MDSFLQLHKQAYAVAPDGRLLLDQDVEGGAVPLTIVLNWHPPAR
jgi:hypothetical protein